MPAYLAQHLQAYEAICTEFAQKAHQFLSKALLGNAAA